MSQCKNFSPLSLGLIVNCPNCLLWSIGRCKEKKETVVVANYTAGEDESVSWVRW
jgi:hypothetical protein